MSTAHAVRDRSDAVVFFGATGDLAFKQIFPALARLIGDEGWDLPIIGVARHGDVAMLKARAEQSLAAQGPVDAAALKKLQAALRFVKVRMMIPLLSPRCARSWAPQGIRSITWRSRRRSSGPP